MTLKKVTEGRNPETGRFVSGNNGGPGRQRGSRNKLGEAFLADVYESWLKHGAETLEQMRRDDPVAYVRVVANILPDQLDVGVTHTIARIERVIVQLPERVIEHDDTSRKNRGGSGSPRSRPSHHPTRWGRYQERLHRH